MCVSSPNVAPSTRYELRKHPQHPPLTHSVIFPPITPDRCVL